MSFPHLFLSYPPVPSTPSLPPFLLLIPSLPPIPPLLLSFPPSLPLLSFLPSLSSYLRPLSHFHSLSLVFSSGVTCPHSEQGYRIHPTVAEGRLHSGGEGTASLVHVNCLLVPYAISTQSLEYSLVYYHVPYSGKLSKKKTFANFVVLWLYAKVFSAKFGAWHLLARQKQAIHESKNRIFTDSQNFSPSKVSHYTVFTSDMRIWEFDNHYKYMYTVYMYSHVPKVHVANITFAPGSSCCTQIAVIIRIEQ